MIEYTENQKTAIDLAANFVKQRIEPIASRMDEQEEFPVAVVKELGELGLLGIPFPEKYGGSGLDYITYTAVIKEIAKACASTAMTVVAHTTLTGYPIYSFGSDSQKDKYLQPLFSGEKIGAFGLTEPNAGSDFAAAETKAVMNDGSYILNGNKIFITNANYADIFIAAAKTTPDKGMMGMSLFILEKGIKGFRTSGKKERKLGMRASDTGELIFEDAVIPETNLLGRKNFGLKILHDTLVTARLGMAAIALGISESARDKCLTYVKQRKQFGKSLSQHQSIRNMLADMEVNIKAAGLMLYHASAAKDAGKDITKSASEVKLFSSEMSMQITKNAIQIFGGYGYMREFPLERYFRDAKLTEIGDGTSEMQRMVIAGEMLKGN
jgi:alkylation response protein AidB-like acyl-CoA dehydrogenase